MKKKIRQDVESNSFKRYQVAGTLAGYLENQYSGRYLDPGAQIWSLSFISMAVIVNNLLEKKEGNAHLTGDMSYASEDQIGVF